MVDVDSRFLSTINNPKQANLPKVEYSVAEKKKTAVEDAFSHGDDHSEEANFDYKEMEAKDMVKSIHPWSTSLSAMCCPFDLEQFVNEIIQKNTEIWLRKLNLTHKQTDAASMGALAQLINSSKADRMEEVNLRNCDLDTPAIQKFRDALKTSKEIRELNLSENYRIWDNDGMTCLGEIVEGCKVQILKLDDCCLTTEHLATLSTFTSSVKEISFQGNFNIFPEAIDNLVKSWPSLSLVNLARCEIPENEREEIQTINHHKVEYRF